MRQKSERGRGLVLIFLVSAIALFATVGRAAEEPQRTRPTIGFKLSGGIGLALNGGGDLETYRQGMIDLYHDVGTIDYFTGVNNWKKMVTIPNFELDLIFHLNERVGIGIGTGYLQATSQGDYGFVFDQAGSESWGTYTLSATTSNVEDFKISAIPIRLSLYLTFPSGRWTTYGYAGAGFYLGKFSHKYTYDFKYNYADSSTIYLDEKQEITSSDVSDESAKKNSFGFHGGLGLEYRLGSFLSLGLELFGRFVNFSGWEGDAKMTSSSRQKDWREDSGWYFDQSMTDTQSTKGKLWYYESQDLDLGKYYPQLNMWGAPSGSTSRNARDAAINLNAFGLAVTVRVFFNL